MILKNVYNIFNTWIIKNFKCSGSKSVFGSDLTTFLIFLILE